MPQAALKDPVTRVAQEIKNAEQGKRVTTILYQSLQNAQELEGIDLISFCQEAGIPKSFATEIRKMIALSKYMKEIGIKLTSRNTI